MAKTQPKETSLSQLFVTVEYDDEQQIMDIWSAYEVVARYKGKAKYYYERVMPDNMTLEELSYDLYETPTLWWLIALFNDIVDPFTALSKDSVGNEQVLKIIKPNFLPDIFYAIKRAKRNK